MPTGRWGAAIPIQTNTQPHPRVFLHIIIIVISIAIIIITTIINTIIIITIVRCSGPRTNASARRWRPT